MTNPEIDKFGNQRWYNSAGVYHREDGPAFIGIDGLQSFWFNGKVHRTDGPAIISKGRYQLWRVNDKGYRSNKSFQKAAKLSNEDMIAIVLKYGNVE